MPFLIQTYKNNENDKQKTNNLAKTKKFVQFAVSNPKLYQIRV